MPRLIRYTTSGIVPNEVPDTSLMIIEHTALFYMIDKRFSGMNKFLAFAVAGAGYEFLIADLKAKDADSSLKR